MPTYRLAQEKVTLTMGRVCELESLLNVETRWREEDQQYKDTLVYISQRTYRRTVDVLERLVVQRVFELQKTHLASTGE